jgi:hypothetical protein
MAKLLETFFSGKAAIKRVIGRHVGDHHAQQVVDVAGHAPAAYPVSKHSTTDSYGGRSKTNKQFVRQEG